MSAESGVNAHTHTHLHTHTQTHTLTFSTIVSQCLAFRLPGPYSLHLAVTHTLLHYHLPPLPLPSLSHTPSSFLKKDSLLLLRIFIILSLSSSVELQWHIFCEGDMEDITMLAQQPAPVWYTCFCLSLSARFHSPRPRGIGPLLPAWPFCASTQM